MAERAELAAAAFSDVERTVLDRARELVAQVDDARVGGTVEDRAAFLGAKFDAGLAWVHFPEGLGGLDAPPALQVEVERVLAAAGLPQAAPSSSIGYGMCAPALVEWGNYAQKLRYLRPLYTGEEIWCQLFSEPGAGSDVAGLSTAARLDGDHWVVNGQKVWTSYGHLARWGLLIARTDPDAFKHAGLTAFVIDMDQPGVDVRPLRQITGEAQFNEVFLDDARAELDDRLGEVGQGWPVALTTLMNERVAIGGKAPGRGDGAIAPLVESWRGTPAQDRDAVTADRVAELWIRAELLRLTNSRHAAVRAGGGDPGPIGSVGKVVTAELNQQIAELRLELEGPRGLVFDYRACDPEQLRPTAQYAFLRSRANSIEGGSSEIMKNVLGERVLGLPPEPRVDRRIPWRDIPRG